MNSHVPEIGNGTPRPLTRAVVLQKARDRLWVRGIVLAAIWTLVLQPLVSSAQLAQSPMFTVTSAPPNVMLMFDDSSSMNRLDLNPPPAYTAPVASWRYPWLTGTPLLKINTVGYFGISGMAYYFGGQYRRVDRRLLELRLGPMC